MGDYRVCADLMLNSHQPDFVNRMIPTILLGVPAKFALIPLFSREFMRQPADSPQSPAISRNRPQSPQPAAIPATDHDPYAPLSAAPCHTPPHAATPPHRSQTFNPLILQPSGHVHIVDIASLNRSNPPMVTNQLGRHPKENRKEDATMNGLLLLRVSARIISPSSLAD